MSAEKPEQPWWRRTWAVVTAGILSAGALASAVAAILGLVWPDPDLVDKAEITSIDLILAVPLSEYERREQGLGPQSLGTSPRLRLVGHPVSAQEQGGSTDASPDASPGGPATDSPASPVSTSGSPTPSASESASESASGSPTTGSPTPPPFDVFGELPPGFALEESRYHDVIEEAETTAPGLGLELGDDDRPSRTMIAMISTMEDESGEPVPPEEAARRLVQVLGNTRAARTPEGKRDPLGVLVTANLQLEGLKGRELGIFWEIWSAGGASRLYDRWLDEVPVSRVRAEKDRDAGAFQFWVPMPRKTGEYVIHVRVKEDDNLLFVGRSDAFE